MLVSDYDVLVLVTLFASLALLTFAGAHGEARIRRRK